MLTINKLVAEGDIRCSKCEELVMETRAVYTDGRPYCLRCAGEKCLGVVGRGITRLEWGV